MIPVLQGACVLAGYLKLLPLFIMVFPGMAARILFPDEASVSEFLRSIEKSISGLAIVRCIWLFVSSSKFICGTSECKIE